MDSFIKFFTSKDPSPRGWSIFCAAVALILSVLINMHLQNAARVDQYRVQQIQVMFDSMVQFQTFASAFAAEMNEDGKVKTETRSKLVQNLNDQFGRIRIIQQSVRGVDDDALKAYREKVTKMVDAVNDTHDISSMRDFWSAASDLLVARNKLNQELKSQI